MRFFLTLNILITIMKKFLSVLGFDPGKHSVRVELLAGLTTFLTMSYILAVNPFILGETGMDKGALFSATVVAAAIATLVMAFYARLPFALATGMGLNAFFAYTLVITMGYTWQQALAAVLFEGVIFILLTLFKVREAIVNAIPINLRYAISVGIGMFIAYIGLKNGGIIVASDATVTTLGPWTAMSILAGAGISVQRASMTHRQSSVSCRAISRRSIIRTCRRGWRSMNSSRRAESGQRISIWSCSRPLIPSTSPVCAT